MKSWFTQPRNSFASYYLFDETNGDFVRIRLELNRGDGDGPKIMVRKNRHVGFFEDSSLNRNDKNLWKAAENGTIKYNGVKLGTDPVTGMNVYDFSAVEGESPISKPHLGNIVADLITVRLPAGIEEEHLRKIATYYLRQSSGRDLTASNASESDLTNSIQSLYISIG